VTQSHEKASIITQCVGAASPASAEEPDLSMTDVANDVITSKLPDLGRAALTAEVVIDNDAYAKIMCDSAGGNSVTSAYKFNSSI
jgi:hypothetical protein